MLLTRTLYSQESITQKVVVVALIAQSENEELVRLEREQCVDVGEHMPVYIGNVLDNPAAAFPGHRPTIVPHLEPQVQVGATAELRMERVIHAQELMSGGERLPRQAVVFPVTEYGLAFLHRRYDRLGTASNNLRASVYLYNTEDECETFCEKMTSAACLHQKPVCLFS